MAEPEGRQSKLELIPGPGWPALRNSLGEGLNGLERVTAPCSQRALGIGDGVELQPYYYLGFVLLPSFEPQFLHL